MFFGKANCGRVVTTVVEDENQLHASENDLSASHETILNQSTYYYSGHT
jgi:hypothetical protein